MIPQTRLIVTHNITYLSQSNLIVLLENGTITESGTYEELISKNGNFAEFLRTYSNEKSSEKGKTTFHKNYLIR